MVTCPSVGQPCFVNAEERIDHALNGMRHSRRPYHHLEMRKDEREELVQVRACYQRFLVEEHSVEIQYQQLRLADCLRSRQVGHCQHHASCNVERFARMLQLCPAIVVEHSLEDTAVHSKREINAVPC